MMPVMDGMEATRIIKSQESSQSGSKYGALIVGFSALTDEKSKKQWYDNGIDCFLTKPP
eukprot:CAMPEP_0170562142 /NCGR_PEP_ID=MMETSP0211-20121228/59031_1 /TAXON_ID=311385 /ORGANISM="Pseudokeronopsis sp., Strain OXSARD2" /LENGTH=58 /DNA_ID=CAMNT_0010878643 /DNA_START=8 /DNA_END=184 /DNA_ORIENTATION=-